MNAIQLIAALSFSCGGPDQGLNGRDIACCGPVFGMVKYLSQRAFLTPMDQAVLLQLRAWHARVCQEAKAKVM